MDGREIGLCLAMGIFVLGHLYSCFEGDASFGPWKRSIQIGALFAVFLLCCFLNVEGTGLVSSALRIVVEVCKYIFSMAVSILSFSSLLEFKGD